MPKPIKARAKERLQRALDAIPGLKQAKYDSPEFEKWERDTKVAIDYAFEGSPSKTSRFCRHPVLSVCFCGRCNVRLSNTIR